MRRLFSSLFILFSFLSNGQRPIDVQHYKYELELSDASDAITGKATITIDFRENVSFFQLDFASGSKAKGMFVYGVTENGRKQTVFQKDDLLTVNLTRPAAKNEKRTFEIRYRGAPKDGLIISKNKYNERTFFADNWPDRAHQWIPCNDRLTDKASVEFIVKAPDSYRVVANGELVAEKGLGNGLKLTHWKEDRQIPTKVMVIGVARFAVQRVDSSYHIPVTAWVFKKDSAKGVYDFGLADDICRFFESYIGSYPYGKLANVQSKTIFGGMENAGTIFYAEDLVTGDRSAETVIAHEIAHQWFGNTATEKSFGHLWLSEGFADYLADIYIEKKYGREAFRQQMKQHKQKIIAFPGSWQRPVVDTVSKWMDLLSANSYDKGAWVLHMLRNQVGDSSFQRILRAYYNEFKFGNADSRDFEKVAERISGKQLGWFFDQWLYQPGMPVLQISQTTENDVHQLRITQMRGIYRFPLQVIITTADSQVIVRRLSIEDRDTVCSIQAKGPLKIAIDPDSLLLYIRKD
jgi:aminopeptidase N